MIISTTQPSVFELPLDPNPAEIESPTSSIFLARGVGSFALPFVVNPKKMKGFAA